MPGVPNPGSTVVLAIEDQEDELQFDLCHTELLSKLGPPSPRLAPPRRVHRDGGRSLQDPPCTLTQSQALMMALIIG